VLKSATARIRVRSIRRGHVDFGHDGDDDFGSLETFVTLQTSRAGEVFRGVAFAPTP
jgi:hypothetical protein